MPAHHMIWEASEGQSNKPFLLERVGALGGRADRRSSVRPPIQAETTVRSAPVVAEVDGSRLGEEVGSRTLWVAADTHTSEPATGCSESREAASSRVQAVAPQRSLPGAADRHTAALEVDSSTPAQADDTELPPAAWEPRSTTTPTSSCSNINYGLALCKSVVRRMEEWCSRLIELQRGNQLQAM